jgi:hypothetical protein
VFTSENLPPSFSFFSLSKNKIKTAENKVPIRLDYLLEEAQPTAKDRNPWAFSFSSINLAEELL